MSVIFNFSEPDSYEISSEYEPKHKNISNENQKISDYFHKFCEKRNKKLITLRLDEDIIDWFQSKGSGYQTRMNAALCAVMQIEKDKEEDLF